jgi:monofunctional biosynthetic peptidoglycan transglycosylase
MLSSKVGTILRQSGRYTSFARQQGDKEASMHSLLSGLSAAVIVCAAITAASAQEPVKDHLLFDFEGKKGQWVSVNDDVMGGVSRGGGRTTAEGTLDFSGVLSLENNGGFSSIRAVLEPGALSGHEGLVLRTRGDGRAYYVNLHMESRVTAGSWRAPLSTPKGTWKDVRLPFSEFGWTVFGRRLPSSSLDPSQVRSLGFTIADKTDGPFQLQVDWIKAYGAAEREPDLLERAAGVEDLSIFAQAVDSQ